MLRRMFVMTMFLFPVGLFQGLKTDLTYQVDKTILFCLLRFARAYLDRLQSLWNDILHVIPADLTHSLDREGILLIAIGQYVPHQIFKYILFDEDGGSFCHLQGLRIIREILQGVQIGIQFVVKATFKPAALSGQLALIDRQVLISGGGGVDGFKVT
jgi:hypothetical protein